MNKVTCQPRNLTSWTWSTGNCFEPFRCAAPQRQPGCCMCDNTCSHSAKSALIVATWVAWAADKDKVSDRGNGCLQAELMYPHIATTDGKASINATWLRSLNNRNYHFTDWENEKAFKAVIGPRGEKAIINGDILPSPAGMLLHAAYPLFLQSANCQ